MVGRRHYEVAKLLKDIPKGTVFTLRLIEPIKAGFCKYYYLEEKKNKIPNIINGLLFIFMIIIS